MIERMQYPKSDPRHHSQKTKQMFHEVADHSRQDMDKVSDLKAQALFETTAQVLIGLEKAFTHFERRSENAWK
jgi:hypothetical protein